MQAAVTVALGRRGLAWRFFSPLGMAFPEERRAAAATMRAASKTEVFLLGLIGSSRSDVSARVPILCWLRTTKLAMQMQGRRAGG